MNTSNTTNTINTNNTSLSSTRESDNSTITDSKSVDRSQEFSET